jgi:predicted Rossmann-fold nucleotide-binding protein
MVVFPGGFGTLDELCELLTLLQTGKIDRPLPIVLFGKDYWNEVINFDALVRWGTISPADLDLFRTVDDPHDAFEYLKGELTRLYLEDVTENETDEAGQPT